MLWLAVHLPRLPLEVFQRGHSPGEAANDASALPLAVSSGGSGPRILLADAGAVRHGIGPGMALSAAYALAPDLEVLDRDPALEIATLESLALWAEQFTPTLSLAPPEALLLEIGGCLKLFSGLEALAGRVRGGLAELGFDACLSSAPTPGGALMLARNGLEEHIGSPVRLRERLARLPLEALGAPAPTVTALAQLGLRTIGECLRLPRDGLARRFGPALAETLGRAFGDRPDPRAPFVPPPRFSSRLVLPAPVADVERLLFGARRLVLELAGFLAGRQAGVTRCSLYLEHETGPATVVAIELSMPSRDAAHLSALVRERLSRTVLPGATEALVLACDASMQLAPRNFSFFPDNESAAEDRTVLVERLRARLGRDSVHGLALVPEHRPELAFREAEPGTAQPALPGRSRPAWLLPVPRPVPLHSLELLGPPERIESGWWDGQEVRRDYYTALLPGGSLGWVYREYEGHEPESPGETAHARWFLHGYFA